MWGFIILVGGSLDVSVEGRWLYMHCVSGIQEIRIDLPIVASYQAP